jgi:hypothetical protein
MKMKRILTSALISLFFYILSAQIPQGFNYQAIARGPDGKEITNTKLQVKISILSDTNGFYEAGKGTYVYEELQEVTTNNLGLFTLTVGDKNATWVQGTVEVFSVIDWDRQPLFIGTKINYKGWQNMGTARLWSVPYALKSGTAASAVTAGNLSGPVDKIAVTGTSTLPDDILFEVKNHTGQTIFAVYNEGVRIFVDDGLKGTKGGFAIGSFGTAKAPSQEYLRVTRDSTRVYVNPNVVKGNGKGGFAIGGFGTAKGSADNYLELRKENYFIGYQAGYSNTGANYNSFIGHQSGYSNTIGQFNAFMGYQTGYYNSIGSRNIFMGYQSGFANTSGENNVFQGYQAGNANTTGSWNIFIGPYAGWRNKTGYSNIIIGNMAGYFCTSSDNTIIGQQAGSADTSGMLNVFIGNFSGEGTTNGSNNTYVGYGASRMNNTGTNNTSLGISAGFNNHGNTNTLLGAFAGYNSTNGSGNVFIGNGAGYNEAGSNRLVISNNQTGALIYGEFDNQKLTINGNVGIGRYSPAARLDIAGGNWLVAGSSEGDFRIGDANYRFKMGIATSGGGAGDVRMTAMGGTNRLIMGGNGVDVLAITNTNVYPWSDNLFSLGLSSNRWSVVYSANGVVTTSDIRLKSNIQGLDYGLESIMKLEPVSYTWKDGSDRNRKIGLIAQDVDKVISEVVDKGNDPSQTLGINYSELVPVLIKGMQEQQKQIDATVLENQQLKSDLQHLKEEISEIRSMLISLSPRSR